MSLIMRPIFHIKGLLTNTQVLRICRALSNGSSANMRFSKTQLSKMVQLEGRLGFLGVLDCIRFIDSLANNSLKENQGK